MSALQEILHDLIHLTSMNQGQRDQMHDKVDQLEATAAADVSRETPLSPAEQNVKNLQDFADQEAAAAAAGANPVPPASIPAGPAGGD